MEENQNTAPAAETLPTDTAVDNSVVESADTSAAVVDATTDATTDDTAVEDNSNDADDSDSSDTTTTTKKPSNGFDKRIERFNRRLQEKEAEIEHWRKAALATNGQNNAQNTQQSAPVDSDKPKFTDYNDIDTYTEAVTEWKLNQRDLQTRQQAAATTYMQKEALVRQANPDYDEVINEFTDMYKHVSAPEVNQFLADSDLGPELFYHLANNTAEVDRILQLSPLRRIAELGKIEAKLTPAKADTKSVANKVTKAPPPVSKEKGVAPTIKRLDDPNLAQSEYRQLRMQNKRRF